MHRLIGGILLIFVLSGLAAFAEETPPPYKIINSELGPAKIAIAQPAKWNGKALLLAHDMRPEKAPLTADFAVSDPYLGSLLKEGWLVAATSYRRNGYLLDEGVEDLDQLRAYVIKTYGKPKRLVVAGEGTGGAIVTRLAETRKGQYDGALAVSPVLLAYVNKYDYLPKLPLLFACTQDESYEPKNYVAKAAELKAPFPPALWLVNREGSGKINDRERLLSLQGLLNHIDTGKSPGEKDITTEAPTSSSGVTFDYGGVVATVKAIVSEEYGNLNTNITAADLEKIGLSQGARVVIYCRDKSVIALFGATYTDVPQGEWVVLMEGGILQVARCGENAAAYFGCQVGEPIYVDPVLGRNTMD